MKWIKTSFSEGFSDQCAGRCGGSNSTTNMTDNNGNLKNQDVEIPTSGGGISAAWRDGFTYDSLNRLTQVNEYTGNSSFDWQQKYILDRYGNRTIDYNNTSTNIPRPQFNVDTNTNRLTVPNGNTGTMSYDNADNLINDTTAGRVSAITTPRIG